MIDKQNARLNQRKRMMLTDDLIPYRRQVAVIRIQRRVESRAELDFEIGQSRLQIDLRLPRRSPLEDVGLNGPGRGETRNENTRARAGNR